MPRLLPVCLAALFLLAGCPKAGPVPPAEKPRRPEAKPRKVKKKAPNDCKPTVIEESPAAVPFKQRVVVESENLSKKGIALIRDANKEGIGPAEREAMIIEGVEDLLTSLKADPYNVDATYTLAATYAKIGRAQCAINLLERLALLRKLASHRPNVEKKVDRLIGRGKKTPLDPAFDDIRADEPFRDVVEKLVAPL
jgi:hypothetical protein